MKRRTVVFGAGGLAGGELLRLLSLHPEGFEIVALSRSHGGKKAGEIHLALFHLPEILFQNLSPTDAVRPGDMVFCALPHGKSQEIMEEIFAANPACVIDLAADFRIVDPAVFARYYEKHKTPALIDRFVYGLPEAFIDQIKPGRHIANPGCFATAAQLLLLPLAAAGLLPEHPAVFAVTGSTGSGIHPKPTTHHPFRDGNFFAYKMLAHQHEGEIDQTFTRLMGKKIQCRLLSHSGPFVRGIHATTCLYDPALETRDIAGLYRDYYSDDKPFVSMLDRPPQLAEVNGTNFVHVHVRQQGPEVEIALAMDNLVKGAAGQAIQNMNLVLGLDETAGLTFPGVFPC